MKKPNTPKRIGRGPERIRAPLCHFATAVADGYTFLEPSLAEEEGLSPSGKKPPGPSFQPDQLLYFTEQPYGSVVAAGTGLPVSSASTAVFTWLSGFSVLPRGSSSMAPT